MPWSNNSGDGGWKGGGGPWGSGPQNRGPQAPDLEELLRRSQDRLRNALPGGMRGGGVWLIALVAVLALWLFQSVYTVQPDQLGQELVFGDPKSEVSEPGLHFLFWPVETVEKVNIRQQREFIGSDNANRRTSADSSLMLSGDQNIVEVDFSVIWRVSDPKLFLFNVNNPEDFVRLVAESAMREAVGRSRAEDVRTERRAEVEETVRSLVQSTLDDYGAGITIIGIQLEQADPPAEVADAFEEVQRAQQDLDRFQREAEAYANKRLGEARGQAAQIREAAQGYKQQVIAEAEGEAERFNSVLEEYAEAKDVTRRRLYLETMEKVFRDSNKILLNDEGGPGVVPYLPLDQLQRQRPRPDGSSAPGPSATQSSAQGGSQ